MTNTIILVPEYDFTAHEIAMINQGEVLQLQNEKLAEMKADHILYPQYLSYKESKRLGVAGSNYNDMLDFDDNQEPAMALFSDANRYANETRRLVEKMYEEAYAANDYPHGPEKYFEMLKAIDMPQRSLVSRLLGTLSLHFINKDSKN